MSKEMDLLRTNFFRTPSLFGNWDRVMDDFFSSNRVAENTFFAPKANIEETDEYYLLSLDLPGVNKTDVKLEVHDNRLSISGERKQERREKRGNTLLEERSIGQFSRSFLLPEDVNPENIEAHHDHGVLRVVLHKAEKKRPKTIPVETEKKGFFSKLVE